MSDEENTPPRPAILLRVGQPAEVDLEFPTTLDAYQVFVGGSIDVVPLRPGIRRELEARFSVRLGARAAMVVHEEGIVIGLPLNALASQLYGGPICGDALVQDVP